jgi:hypothetical protein
MRVWKLDNIAYDIVNGANRATHLYYRVVQQEEPITQLSEPVPDGYEMPGAPDQGVREMLVGYQYTAERAGSVDAASAPSADTPEREQQWIKDSLGAEEVARIESELDAEIAEQRAPTKGVMDYQQYSEWSGDGVIYLDGNQVNYQGTIWECLQDHTSQADWSPVVARSLWKVWFDPFASEPPAWIQPQGAHDAYPRNALVCHNEAVWESDVDANVWEPGVSQWTQRTDLDCGGPMP